MKGLMVALLVFLTTGTVYGQQNQGGFSPSNIGNARGSSTRPNRTNLSPLLQQNGPSRPVFRTAASPAQQSVGTERPFFGPEYNPGARSNAENNSFGGSSGRTGTDRPVQIQDQNQRQNQNRFNSSNPTFRDNRSQDFSQSQTTGQRTAEKQPYELKLNQTDAELLRQHGFSNPVSFDRNLVNRISNVLIYGGPTALSRGQVSSNITSDKIETNGDIVIIDVDDYSLGKIQSGSYSLNDFAQYNADKIVLRYVGENQQKIDTPQLLAQIYPSARRDAQLSTNTVAGGTNRSIRSVERPPTNSEGTWTMPRDDQTTRRQNQTRQPNSVFIQTNSPRRNGDLTPIQPRSYLDQISGTNGSRTTGFNRDPNYIDRRAGLQNPTQPQTQTQPDNRVSIIQRQPQQQLQPNQQRQLPHQPAFDQPQYRSTWESERQIMLDRLADQRLAEQRLADQRLADQRFAEVSNRQQRPSVDDRFADLRTKYSGGFLAGPNVSPQTPDRLAELQQLEKNMRDRDSRIRQKQEFLKISQGMENRENLLDKEIEAMGTKRKSFKQTFASFEPMGMRMADAATPPATNEFAMNQSITNRPITKRINSVQHAASNVSQTSTGGQGIKLLWMFTFGFLALSMYMGISLKSAYSRYDELAEELKETFSTTT